MIFLKYNERRATDMKTLFNTNEERLQRKIKNPAKQYQKLLENYGMTHSKGNTKTRQK